MAGKRRWFQFGLGTMLLLVTLLCVWLAWQMHVVRERELVRASVTRHGAVVTALKDRIEWKGFGTSPQISVPFWRQWVGDEPIAGIAFSPDADEADVERAQRVFPEASVFQFERSDAR